MADEKRAVPYAKGKALADEYNIRFFETSAKDNINVEEVRAHRSGHVPVQLHAFQRPKGGSAGHVRHMRYSSKASSSQAADGGGGGACHADS
jgi:Ras-related protein Rab-8A